MEYALARRSKGSGPAPVRPIRRHGPARRAGFMGHAWTPGGPANSWLAASPRLPVVQAKLEIGAPNDRFEQEAELVAEQVMRMPDPAIGTRSAPLGVQRLCAECEEEVQRQPIEEEDEELRMTRLRRDTRDRVGPAGADQRVTGRRPAPLAGAARLLRAPLRPRLQPGSPSPGEPGGRGGEGTGRPRLHLGPGRGVRARPIPTRQQSGPAPDRSRVDPCGPAGRRIATLRPAPGPRSTQHDGGDIAAGAAAPKHRRTMSGGSRGHAQRSFVGQVVQYLSD